MSTPGALAPRRGNNITQVFVCAVVVVVPPGPCPGGEYLWINQNPVRALGYGPAGAPLDGSEFIDYVGLSVPAGTLTIVSWTSSDSGTGRIAQARRTSVGGSMWAPVRPIQPPVSTPVSG